jgi:putative DNA primase/helicase
MSDNIIPIDAAKKEKRPYFRVYDKANDYGTAGLYWHSTKGTGEDTKEVNAWVCSPIYANARTASEKEEDFGLLLRFKNSNGNWREWCMPMSMLSGSGEEIRSELLSLGVRISPTFKNKLNEWLMQQYPKRRLLAATRTGWHGKECFVLPNEVIGKGDIRYQSPYAANNEFSIKGTLKDWQQEIGKRCQGNAMLQLAISASLSGTLLEKLHRTSCCGIHFIWDSSIGKTTALYAAASIWGSREFVRAWRTTSNGLEGIAAALNDTALILDEISQVDSKEVGAIVYALGNGVGKSRATKTGGAREVARWKLTFLSSGERSLEATMLEGGKRIKAGQEVRLLNIPCKRTYGIFDVLHDEDGRAQADAIQTATKMHHGHVGIRFIDKLIADSHDLSAELATYMTLSQFHSKDSLEGRAASHFALFALAGELGIEYGLLPWNRDEALNAAAIGYQLWREFRGEGQTEDKQILHAVEDFLAKHGDSRFSYHKDFSASIRDRCGWTTKDATEETVYMFTSAGLKEATKGFDFKRVLEALDKSGWIIESDTGKAAKTTRVLGRLQKLYYIQPKNEE